MKNDGRPEMVSRRLVSPVALVLKEVFRLPDQVLQIRKSPA
jgi:hypothetical protein